MTDKYTLNQYLSEVHAQAVLNVTATPIRLAAFKELMSYYSEVHLMAYLTTQGISKEITRKDGQAYINNPALLDLGMLYFAHASALAPDFNELFVEMMTGFINDKHNLSIDTLSIANLKETLQTFPCLYLPLAIQIFPRITQACLAPQTTNTTQRVQAVQK